MKRLGIITSIFIIVLLSTAVFNTATTHESSYTNAKAPSSLSSLEIDQELVDQYYPIFDGVETNDATDIINVRSRNETNGEGAIVKVESFANITIRYAVALDNETTFDDTVGFRLFADLPFVNTTNFNNTGSDAPLSLDNETETLPLTYSEETRTEYNYTLPYNSDVTLDNATLYIYTTVLENVTAGYIPFYAEDTSTDGLSEVSSSKPYNLLTTSQYFNTSSEEEFYIQNEILNITGSIYFTDVSTMDFGVSYRVNEGNFQDKNFSLTGPINETDTISLKDYKPGTTITWFPVFYANDTLLNLSRTIELIEYKSLTIGDGTPELDVELSSNTKSPLLEENSFYSANFTVTFTVETGVAKGNITDLFLVPDVNESAIQFPSVNNSYSIEAVSLDVNFSSFENSVEEGGNFTTVITTITDKGLTTNETFEIIIDKGSPTIDKLQVRGGTQQTSQNGEVTFDFNYFDDRAGIKAALIDFGDGNTVEVTGLTEYTHKYRDFDGKTFDVTIEVIDRAGNSASFSTFVQINDVDVDRTSAPLTEVLIFFIGLIAILSSPFWGPKIVERFR